MAKNPIFLEFIFFYLLIPLMGHHNAPKKCCRAKLGGGACRPPVAPNLSRESADHNYQYVINFACLVF